ncbi:MAG: hypothetical protein SFW09_14110 [Hyphomicrobiaceae bacterium]|nr:hypothetical protein [Hyphomicrobiaceae bacterium]
MTRADELYYCDDGRILKVDTTNRARLASDPCVTKWFETTRTSRDAWRRHAFLHAPGLPWRGCWWSCYHAGFVIYYWRHYYDD